MERSDKAIQDKGLIIGYFSLFDNVAKVISSVFLMLWISHCVVDLKISDESKILKGVKHVRST